MQYAILFYETEKNFENRDRRDHSSDYSGAWRAYINEIVASGIVRGGAGLYAPQAATTVRLKDGHRHVQDGPFAAAKEQLGGFFLIDVPDIDAALGWAAKAPCAATGVEVRPTLPSEM